MDPQPAPRSCILYAGRPQPRPRFLPCSSPSPHILATSPPPPCTQPLHTTLAHNPSCCSAAAEPEGKRIGRNPFVGVMWRLYVHWRWLASQLSPFAFPDAWWAWPWTHGPGPGGGGSSADVETRVETGVVYEALPGAVVGPAASSSDAGDAGDAGDAVVARQAGLSINTGAGAPSVPMTLPSATASTPGPEEARPLLGPRPEEDAECREVECCVCMNAPADTKFLPCGHICLCAGCADRVAVCPLCRTRIDVRQFAAFDSLRATGGPSKPIVVLATLAVCTVLLLLAAVLGAYGAVFSLAFTAHGDLCRQWRGLRDGNPFDCGIGQALALLVTLLITVALFGLAAPLVWVTGAAALMAGTYRQAQHAAACSLAGGRTTDGRDSSAADVSASRTGQGASSSGAGDADASASPGQQHLRTHRERRGRDGSGGGMDGVAVADLRFAPMVQPSWAPNQLSSTITGTLTLCREDAGSVAGLGAVLVLRIPGLAASVALYCTVGVLLELNSAMMSLTAVLCSGVLRPGSRFDPGAFFIVLVVSVALALPVGVAVLPLYLLSQMVASGTAADEATKRQLLLKHFWELKPCASVIHAASTTVLVLVLCVRLAAHECDAGTDDPDPNPPNAAAPAADSCHPVQLPDPASTRSRIPHAPRNTHPHPHPHPHHARPEHLAPAGCGVGTSRRVHSVSGQRSTPPALSKSWLAHGRSHMHAVVLAPPPLAHAATVYNLAIIVVFTALTASLTVFWASNALRPHFYSPRFATRVALVATAPAGLLLIHLGVVAAVGLVDLHGLRGLMAAVDRAGLMIGVTWHGGTTLLLWRAMLLYGGG